MDDLNPQLSFTKLKVSLVLYKSIGLLIGFFNDIHDSNPTVKSEGLQPI